jgi:SAM-dependent methyltransferase
MEERAFGAIHQAEESWFYRSRSFAIQRILKGFKAHGEKICEVGAGYGAMCATLKPFGSVAAFEPDAKAREHCRKKCDNVFEGSDLNEFVSQEKASFTLVAILDVIEHVEDDVGFARQLSELLTPGGHLLVTVPAYQWLWSELDTLAMHYRRYNKNQIIKVLESAGFEIEYASYWNALLLLPLIVVRRGTKKPGYSAFSLPKWIDRLLLMGANRIEPNTTCHFAVWNKRIRVRAQKIKDEYRAYYLNAPSGLSHQRTVSSRPCRRV